MESEVKMHLKYQELKLICKTCSLEESPSLTSSLETLMTKALSLWLIRLGKRESEG